jgi:hypothetical protein
MKNLINLKSLFTVQCFLFLIPINIYLLGEGAAAGIQWIFFRYQQGYLGNSLILFTKDLFYVQTNILTGKSAFAAELTFTASCIFIIATILFAFAYRKNNVQWRKASALLTICSGGLFLISDITQYGVFFNGPAGFVIPVGIPIMLFFGGWIYSMDFTDNDTAEP